MLELPVGLNIFIHINEYKHINKQYITMVYDGIQKEAIRLIRIVWYPNYRSGEVEVLAGTLIIVDVS